MALPVQQGEWTLDMAHSTIGFAVAHLGITTVRGRFTAGSAKLAVGADLASSSLTTEIAMASVDTGNSDRDGHLRSTDVFNVETQPTMAFQSTSISETGDGSYQVTGDMTINGQTKPETLSVTFSGTEVFPMDGSSRAGFSASGTIDKTAYGIEFNVPLAAGGFMLSDNIEVTIDAQLVAS
ncbi:MAG: YceI family protein [Acidimicrobiales bacterium]